MAKKAEVTILGIYLEEHFDIRGLFEIKYLQRKDTTRFNYAKNATDYPRIAERIRKFFNLKTIYHYHLLEPFGPGIPKENTLPAYVLPGEWLLEDSRLINLIANN